MPVSTESPFSSSANPTRASGLKSIFTPKAHKRVQSAGDTPSSRRGPSKKPLGLNGLNHILPADHPHSRAQEPLGERNVNRGPASKSHPYQDSSEQGLHKKTKSSISLRSLLGEKDKTRSPSKSSSPDGSTRRKKPKKTKSSTSLSSLFKRSNRGRKEDSSRRGRDKENSAPGEDAESLPGPVWPQFGSHSRSDSLSAAFVHPSERTLDEEMSLYTPQGYSPSKQRNFHDIQPTLARRNDAKPRPKSDLVASNPFLMRDKSGPSHHRRPSGQSSAKKDNPFGFQSSNQHHSGQKERRDSGAAKRSSKVLTAISGFTSKAKREEAEKTVDRKEVDTAFEELLDSRNIPHNMRDKMRSLDLTIKNDFITKHQGESDPTSSSNSSRKPRSGLNSATGDKIMDIMAGGGRGTGAPSQHSKEPRSRPRSNNFGLPKNASPQKDGKVDGIYSHQRQRSGDTNRPSSRGSMKPDEMTQPSEFVHYLKEVQKPEIVEIGKLHKLRILLRNETVAWVETFISSEGMSELVNLLYRIIKVEWREEHEDNLLHEVLLCLKALCTTSPALEHLRDIECGLFNTLLQMLFDKEKKGPSEFTTRGIIISLLFAHLSAASPEDSASRARTILSYMRDPSPPEESQPLSFIANIYQSRPYSVWCGELSNVTKEVFWIFLHHLNVVPRKKSEDTAGQSCIPFSKKYFPPPHPPVPAAPYIGGVEWDATNYLANHVDLMNGLVASLPTTEERNSLRSELRASGFEKIMGRNLRVCKEKLYPAIHEGLKLWVAAAADDGWEYNFVREGPPRDAPDSTPSSPVKGRGGALGSPKKRPGGVAEAPPRLDLKVGTSVEQSTDDASGWI